MFNWIASRVRFDERWLVSGIILLALAIFLTRTGVWGLVSTAAGVGNPNAQVNPPVVSSPSLSGTDGQWWNLSWDELNRTTDTAPAGESAQSDAPADVDPYEDALATLAALQITAKASMTDYDREADFGEAWMDVDANHCDTRDDILARDLTDVTYRDRKKCVVTAGTLNDPYTGKTIVFQRGKDTSSAVQIDHVVALGNAWASGAAHLSQDERERLANDPENLLAVDGPSNNEKRDSDASQWLPSNTAYRCDYVAEQIHIKDKYDLSVTQTEHDAMAGILTGCAAAR